ncbi:MULTISPECIES: recombinase family protein [Bacillus]|uniref:recombinase family protein n=1 Tax=Bacillus TaxID=1386 RepID=UPI0009939D48|nr:recombinase family protein [Bacillus mycoides]OOR61088.1 recombinase family protein [Bacillus mycoides]
MKCAVYIRVSTDKEEQKLSLTNQRDLFIKYISEKGWDIHEFYVDVETGTTDKREQLQRLIADAKEKKFDVILAKELSRLARNGGLSYQIRDLAEQKGIHIITLENAINTLEGNNNMFGLFAWMYEQESQNVSNRVKSALKTRAEKGLFKGSIPPYGYSLIDRKLFIKQDGTADTVKRIFTSYLSGNGFDKIARDLYNDGVPTPSQINGKLNANDKWQGSTIRLILTNPNYTGDLVQGRSTTKSVTSKVREFLHKEQYIIVPNTHEAIISKEDFEAVQLLIESRKRIRPQSEAHLFTNTLYCHECGKGMHFKNTRKGYVCGSFNRHGKKACTPHFIKESELTLLVLNEFESLSSILKNDSFIPMLESKLKAKKQKINHDISKYTKEIETLKKSKTRTISLLAEEIITKEDYNAFTLDTNKQIGALSLKVENLMSIIEISNDQLAIAEMKKQLDSVTLFNELTPTILHRLIDKIEIKACGTPRIHYRFSVPLFTL